MFLIYSMKYLARHPTLRRIPLSTLRGAHRSHRLSAYVLDDVVSPITQYVLQAQAFIE